LQRHACLPGRSRTAPHFSPVFKNALHPGKALTGDPAKQLVEKLVSALARLTKANAMVTAAWSKGFVFLIMLAGKVRIYGREV